MSSISHSLIDAWRSVEAAAQFSAREGSVNGERCRERRVSRRRVSEALELITRAAIAGWEMLVKSKVRALGERD